MGDRISRLRKKNGLTQKQLAKKTGLIQSLISSYEKGRLKLSAEMAARFAKALNTSTDNIIGLKSKTDDQPQFNLRYIKRIKKIEALSKYKQKQILAMLDSLIRDAENK